MKKMPVILLLLFAHIGFAQQRQVSFSEIDDRSRTIEPAPPAELARALTKDYTTEKEKLRSIFSWITDHIAYRVKKTYSRGASLNPGTPMIFADTAKWKSANDMVAETVLRNGSAVCDGYARLFKTLCDYAGLRSAIITGYARGDPSRSLKFRCNHTWNAIWLDGGWRLLDLTWASGYTNYRGDEFVKRYDERYFLAAPEDFIRDHFPDDLRWTLMEKPPLPREFMAGPYRNKSFSKYRIVYYSPAGGIIEASPGDTVKIILESTDPLADSKMAADTTLAFDSTLQQLDSAVVFAKPILLSNNRGQLQYNFYVDTNSEWLHIVYNHDTILRYRLKIKKDKPSLVENNRNRPAILPPVHP